ncbi:MAG: YciI family protein [Polyangiaceae bacterium]
MKYICLGYYDPVKNAAMSEDELDAMFDECFAYDDHLRESGHYAGGEALQPHDSTLTLYWQNGRVATTDGPYAETKEQLGGLLVLEAHDMNHAIQLMSQHPSVKYGSRWEVRPTADMSAITKASEQRRRKPTAR